MSGTSAVAGAAGADFLCYVTPAEHLSLPGVADVREGVVVTKIAAHAADIARGNKMAMERDRKMSLARKKLDWEAQLKLANLLAKQLHGDLILEVSKSLIQIEFEEPELKTYNPYVEETEKQTE